ncbi:MAG: hypothetical protein ACREP2_09595, partial [Rhodanobacteraceae bacterium]
MAKKKPAWLRPLEMVGLLLGGIVLVMDLTRSPQSQVPAAQQIQLVTPPEDTAPLQFSTPLILALDPAETKQTEVVLHNPRPMAVHVKSVESSCTCTTIVAFPKSIPGEGSARLVLSNLGTETGESHVTITTEDGAYALDVLTHVRGHLPDPRQALKEHIALYKGSGYLWIGVLHDLRGHYENCGCSDHALGGLP